MSGAESLLAMYALVAAVFASHAISVLLRKSPIQRKHVLACACRVALSPAWILLPVLGLVRRWRRRRAG